MIIDTCLILAAGKGTRMGSVGECLPKILFPVFEKTLLELQLEYAKELGCNNIYINTHHKSSLIEEFIISKKIKNVHILHESTLLDSGGAIHNMVNNLQKENAIMTINGDQFLFFDKKHYQSALSKIENSDVVLLSISVDKKDGYNMLETNVDDFVSVVKNELAPEKFYTFSGISLINLSRFVYKNGASKFFDSVAGSDKKVVVEKIDNFEYDDFGTAEKYTESMFKVLNQDSEMFKFLKNQDAINISKIIQKDRSYNSTKSNICNFTNIESIIDGPSVIIGESKVTNKGPGIYMNDNHSKVPRSLM